MRDFRPDRKFQRLARRAALQRGGIGGDPAEGAADEIERAVA